MPRALGSSGGSIVVQPVGSQTKPKVLTKAFTAFKQLFFSVEDIKNPAALYRVLYTLQQNASTTLRILASAPVGGGNLLVGIVFTPGQTLYLQHGLAAPYAGWWCTRAIGGAASFVEAALPPSVTAAQVLPLSSANAGTFDVYVF
jgi:hypothetical protein